MRRGAGKPARGVDLQLPQPGVHLEALQEDTWSSTDHLAGLTYPQSGVRIGGPGHAKAWYGGPSILWVHLPLHLICCLIHSQHRHPILEGDLQQPLPNLVHGSTPLQFPAVEAGIAPDHP